MNHSNICAEISSRTIIIIRLRVNIRRRSRAKYVRQFAAEVAHLNLYYKVTRLRATNLTAVRNHVAALLHNRRYLRISVNGVCQVSRFAHTTIFVCICVRICIWFRFCSCGQVRIRRRPYNLFLVYTCFVRQLACRAETEVCNLKLWSIRLWINLISQCLIHALAAVVVYVFVRIAVLLGLCRCCQVRVTVNPLNLVLVCSCCVRKSAFVRQFACCAKTEISHLEHRRSRLGIFTNGQLTIIIHTTTLSRLQRVREDLRIARSSYIFHIIHITSLALDERFRISISETIQITNCVRQIKKSIRSRSADSKSSAVPTRCYIDCRLLMRQCEAIHSWCIVRTAQYHNIIIRIIPFYLCNCVCICIFGKVTDVMSERHTTSFYISHNYILSARFRNISCLILSRPCYSCCADVEVAHIHSCAILQIHRNTVASCCSQRVWLAAVFCNSWKRHRHLCSHTQFILICIY